MKHKFGYRRHTIGIGPGSEGRGIDYQKRFQAMEAVIINFIPAFRGTGYKPEGNTFFAEYIRHRGGGSAGSENKRLSVEVGGNRRREEPGEAVFKAGYIRIESGQYSVPDTDTVYGAGFAGGFIQFIKKGNDSLFVRNCHVEAAQIGVFRQQGGQIGDML